MSSSQAADGDKWIFTRFDNTPSIRCGMTEQEELSQRQYAASLIRQIGSELKKSTRRPSGLSINTAMVYMHRFYMFHSFTKYPAHSIAPCALFLAAKLEETPIKLEYVIKTTYLIINPRVAPNTLTDTVSEELQQELIVNENLLLQTLGFDLIVSHPHTLVVNCGDLFHAPKSVTRLAYELVTNSLHFTTMCLKYKSETIACVCLHFAFKRYSLSPAKSKEGKDWWKYVDPNIEFETIEEITKEYVAIIEKCRHAFNKWVSIRNHQFPGDSRQGSSNGGTSNATRTASGNSTV